MEDKKLRSCNCIGAYNGGRFHTVDCQGSTDLWNYWHSDEYVRSLDKNKPKPEEPMADIPKLKSVTPPDPDKWADLEHDLEVQFMALAHSTMVALIQLGDSPAKDLMPLHVRAALVSASAALETLFPKPDDDAKPF
jgi:hypothetical protein